MPQTWSKDFVEHIRTVHFALLAICVAAIIVASSRGQSEASRAHREINDIREIVKEWDPAFLQQAVPSQTSQQASVTGLSGDAIRVMIGKADVLCKPEITGSLAYATLKKQRSESSDESSNAQEDNFRDARQLGDRIAVPSTLQEFADTWNSLADGAMIHRVLSVYDSVFATTAAIRHDQSRTKEFIKGIWELETGNPDPNTVKPLRMRLQRLRRTSAAAIKNLQPNVDTEYQLHGTLTAGERYELYFPIESTADQPLDAQALLLAKLPGRRHGSFEETFHDLESVAREYKTADLATVEKIVAAEEGRSEQSLDVFGLKFPANTSVIWALVMVLVVQCYAWVLLGGVSREATRGDESGGVPWVGLSSFLPALVLTWLSLLVLPVAAVVALGVRGLSLYEFAKFSWVLASGAIILSGVLSVLTYRGLPRASNDAKGKDIEKDE